MKLVSGLIRSRPDHHINKLVNGKLESKHQNILLSCLFLRIDHVSYFEPIWNNYWLIFDIYTWPMNRPNSPIYRTKTIFNHVSFGFVFRKIWRALFSWNTRFEVRPFSLLPAKWLILLQIWDDIRHHAKFWIRLSKSWNHVRKSA